MSIEMDVTKQIIDEKINEGISFSLGKLEEEVNQQGGTDRISPDTTIEKYLDLLSCTKVINYNPSSGEYSMPKPKRN
jgi:hypothetical protein